MHRSLQVLLAGIVDYAGLFPPASLAMEDAVTNYAAYKQGKHAWMLGRFIVPASRLGEFENAASGFLPGAIPPWEVSALGGTDLAGDMASIHKFNLRHAKPGRAADATVDTVECKAGDAQQIKDILALIPKGITAYIEIPVEPDPRMLVQVIAGEGGRAKIRTGSVTEEGFPQPLSIIRFIRACREYRIAFKTTAGLHHPIRSMYNLTYAPESPKGMMFGFLNVFVAAACVYGGMSENVAAQVLEEQDPATFHFDEHGLVWRSHRLDNETLAHVRESFAGSFGSCSFREPVDDLRTLKLLE